MKTAYEATAEFWHKGIAIAVGERIDLTPAESRYLHHALREIDTTDLVDAPKAPDLAAREIVSYAVDKLAKRRVSREVVEKDDIV